MSDRIETGAAGTTRLPAQTTQAELPQATGSWAGETVQLVPDALSLLEDAKEELTFAHSERVESKAIEERNVEEASTDIVERVQRIQEMMDQLPDLDPREVEAFSAQVLATRANGMQVLNRLRERFPEPSHQHAALQAALEDARQAGDGDMVKNLQAAAEVLEDEQGAAIRAGLNVTRAAMEAADGDRKAAAELRDSYRATVFGKPGAAAVYKGILDRFGTSGFAAQVKFLTRAAGDELAAAGPSVEAPRLRELLADLSALRTLDTVHERAGLLAQRVGKVAGRDISPVEVMRRVLPLTDEPVNGPAKLLAMPEQCGVPAQRLDAQILFMRETRELLAMMPAGVFRDMDARFSVLGGAQEAMDRLIEREEAES